MLMLIMSPARNYFRFDQEADPTDYNKHESWQKHLKNMSIFANTRRIVFCHLYQELGLFSLEMNLKATGSIST